MTEIFKIQPSSHPFLSVTPGHGVTLAQFTLPSVIFTIQADGRWIRADGVDITDNAEALRTAFVEYLKCTRVMP